MDERELGRDPIVALRAWLAEAQRSADRPQTMTLATATPDGLPSARVVLLRGLDLPRAEGSADDLLRAREIDLFR